MNNLSEKLVSLVNLRAVGGVGSAVTFTVPPNTYFKGSFSIAASVSAATHWIVGQVRSTPGNLTFALGNFCMNLGTGTAATLVSQSQDNIVLPPGDYEFNLQNYAGASGAQVYVAGGLYKI